MRLIIQNHINIKCENGHFIRWGVAVKYFKPKYSRQQLEILVNSNKTVKEISEIIERDLSQTYSILKRAGLR